MHLRPHKNQSMHTKVPLHQTGNNRLPDLFTIVPDSNKLLPQVFSHIRVFVDKNFGRRFHTNPLQVQHLFSHGGREHHSLPFSWALFWDFVELFLKVFFENSIGFVENQHFDSVQGPRWTVVDVVDETTGGCDDDVRVLSKSCFLRFHVEATREKA